MSITNTKIFIDPGEWIIIFKLWS